MQHNLIPGSSSPMMQYQPRNINTYPYQPQNHRQVPPPHNYMVHQQSLVNQCATAPVFTGPVPQPSVPQLHCNLSSSVQILSPAPSLASINFRKLPFYELKHEILKSSFLNTNHHMLTIPANMKCTADQEFHFSFVLSCAMASEITLHRDTTKSEFLVQAQLRITAVDNDNSSTNEFDDFLPMGLMVRVNGRPCSLPPCSPSTKPNLETRRIARPISLTPWIKASPLNVNHIIINWASEQHKHFVITINLVEKHSSNYLLEMLKKNPKISTDVTKLTIRKHYKRVLDDDDDSAENADGDEEDDDVATTVVRASLVCPLAKFRIMYPAKGINCSHLQCFDGFAFISLNEKKPFWTCPVCNRALYYDDLLLDEYFMNILKSDQLTPDCQEVQLFVDGTWKSFEETAQGDRNSTSETSPNSSPKQTVSGSDGSFFEACNVKGNTNNTAVENNDAAAPNTGPVVDLTSDEETVEEITSSNASDNDIGSFLNKLAKQI